MSRILNALCALYLMAGTVMAQEFTGLARVDAAQSRISDVGRKALNIDLFLSQGVPYRLFMLAGPPRLVLDFQEVEWVGLQADTLVDSRHVRQVQFGTFRPGWSRFVAELNGPMEVSQAEIMLDETTGRAHLQIRLEKVSANRFAATVGAPQDPRWDLPAPAVTEPVRERRPGSPLMVVLDPGHGGLDPGAEAESVNEKTLMLIFARELRDLLLRGGGFEVVLTRNDDHFVSLEQRIAIAHQAGADVFLSLHADSLAEGQAHGATVHVLSRDASDAASAKLAERHDRGDLLSGVDLSEADDRLTDVLLDLARQETQPRTEALAQALVAGMEQAGGPMNRRPLRRAAFSVLKAADIPSVLVEVGFLTSQRDLENLQDPEWRAGMARGIRNGLLAWRTADEAIRPLVRQ